jgi:hypothetical protein
MIVKRGDIWLADMNPTRGSVTPQTIEMIESCVLFTLGIT